MIITSFKEASYIKQHLNQVKHVTLNPNGPGVVRIHLIPPKNRLVNVPSVVILNGQDIIPLNLSWAVLLSAFIDEISAYDGKEISQSDWEAVLGRTVTAVKAVYPKVSGDTLKSDLWRITDAFTDVAYGKKPKEDIGLISIGEYASHMKAPHRMDLMISSMARDGVWNCNQKCLHCYAAGQKLAASGELPADEWKKIIDRCREAGIPQLTFTGGEPTLRDDLVELVEYSKWFVTRLNTNGVCLSKELCAQLYEASLDSVQVTFYSYDPKEHNRLVGAENWDKTVCGIKNAVGAGLNVSINTPLCTLNRDYIKTLEFAAALNVKYVSCSGLILTGSARGGDSVSTQLSSDELYSILKDAFEYCEKNDIEISFTSPGWIEENKLREIGFTSIPSCGACLSNMAVAPDGTVIPCQSWLTKDALGNMLTDPWKKIWNGDSCRKIRKVSGTMEQKCQLAQGDSK